MASFGALVKNEYIKILKKVSTKIMILLIILGGLGVALIVRFGFNAEVMDEQVDFSYEISSLEDSQTDDREAQIEFYEYIQSFGLGYNDPEMTLIWTIDEADKIDYTEKNEILKTYLDEGDWKTACKALVNATSDTTEQAEMEYHLKYNISYDTTWKNDLLDQTSTLKVQLDAISDEAEEQELENEIAVNLYMVQNDIQYNNVPFTSTSDINTYDSWTCIYLSAMALSIVGLLLIVTAGGCIANEYSSGTVKFLLITPAKRSKILAAKFVTVMTFGFIMAAVFYVFTLIFSVVFMGFDGLTSPYVSAVDGVASEHSPFIESVKLYLLGSVQIFVLAAFAMMISALSKNSALAIGLGVFLMGAGTSILSIMQMFNIDWARYLLFANTDLAAIYNGESAFPQHTVFFAIMVLIAHTAVFLLTMYDAFCKKEV